MRNESSVPCVARCPLRVLNFLGTAPSFEHLGSEIIYPDGDLVLYPWAFKRTASLMPACREGPRRDWLID